MFAFAPDGRLAGRLLRSGPNETYALEGVTLIDGTASPPRGPVSILVRAGRIAQVLDAASLPETDDVPTSSRLHVQGSFVTPGFIDAHVHLTGLESRDSFRRNIEPHPSVRLLRAIRDANRVLDAGFTTVRHLGHGDAEQSYAVRDAIRAGWVAGPRMLTSGWAISQTGGHGNIRAWPYHLVEELRPRSAFCDGPDACRKFVRRLIGDGADCIKIYTSEGVLSSPDDEIDIPNFTPREIEAMTDEAHRRGVKVAAHSTGLEGSLSAVAGGVDTLEHGPHAPDARLLEMMKAQNTALVPTLSVFEWAAADGVAEGLPAWAAERAHGWLAGRRAMVREAAALGIRIAVGTDSGGPPRGGNNSVELLALIRAGLDAHAAIQAATAGGAEALGLGSDLGVIESGKVADLVVWRADPIASPEALADLSSIMFIVQADMHLGSIIHG